MGTYNVSKIEGWLKDFTSAKDKFTNTYYGDFKKSYIRSCNDSVVVKMRNKLDEHYARISRINSRVKNVWDDFLWDLKTIDNRLAGGKGSTNNSSIGSKLAKLPSLKEYKANLNVRINSISAAVGTVNALGWAEDKNFSENLATSSEILNSTAAVIATSVISGVFKLREKLLDGAVWLGTAAVTGVATHIGFEEWANNKQNEVMDFIAFDFVGKANEILYKNTSIGRNYNDKSLIKYDSNMAQSIQNTTTKVTEFAVATGLTVATGGMAAPLSALIVAGTGFVIGAGDKAEEDFSKEDRSFWGDSKEIAIAGGIKAIEFYSEGKMGAGMIDAASSIISSGGVKNLIGGIKTVLSNGESSLFTKESLKNGLKATFKDVDTYMDSIGAAFNNISYNNKDGVQVNWKGLAKETACNFAMNSVFGFIGNAFETKMTTGMKNTMEGVNPKNVDASSAVKKINVNDDLDDLRKEYDDLINWKNSDEGLYSKRLNEVYGDRSGSSRYKKNMDRIAKLESTLGIKNTGVPESKIHVYYQDIEKSDFNRLRQILDEWGESRGYENYSERALKQYAKTGSMIDPKTGNYYITSTNGARSYLSKLDPDDVAKYLGNFKNSKIKNHPDSKLFTEIDVRERFSKAKKLNTPLEIAQEFNDTKQYLYYKGCSYKYDNATLKKWYKITCDWDEAKQSYKPKSAYDIDEKKLFEFLEKRNLLSDTDKMILNGMKGDTFTQEEKSIICMFTKHGGPDLSAFNRKTEISFLNRKFDGANEEQCLRYANKCVEFYNINHNPPIKLFSSMEEFNNVVDKIASKGIIKQDTIVYRSIDGIFSDGKMLDLNSIKPGDTFNDSAHTSVSVKKITSKGKNGNGIFDRKVQLQILLPEGSHGTYIDSYAGTGLYKQQEILLPRNSTFRVADYPTIDANGVYTYKVELLPPKDAHLPELSTKKLNLYGKMFNKQDKQKGKGAKELLNSMQNNGLLTRFNNEVDDMINKELYNGPKAIAEHDLTHAKNVLLYSMEMGNNLKLNNNQFELLVDAAKYHDVGVVNAKTHSNHAILSSLKIGNDLSLGKKYSEPDLNKLKAIVEFHGKNDIIKLNDGTYRYSDKSLAEVCAKYNVTDPKDIDDVKMIGSILKDADALDRTRFIENIDVNYFRNKEECLDLLPASYELREAISSDEFQKNMNSSRFSETEKNEAWHLFNSEKYPVALINFGLKYYKNYNCTSITNYINSVLK